MDNARPAKVLEDECESLLPKGELRTHPRKLPKSCLHQFLSNCGLTCCLNCCLESLGCGQDIRDQCRLSRAPWHRKVCCKFTVDA